MVLGQAPHLLCSEVLPQSGRLLYSTYSGLLYYAAVLLGLAVTGNAEILAETVADIDVYSHERCSIAGSNRLN